MSDLEVLRMVRRRAASGFPGLAVGVRSDEAPPKLADASDVLLEGPLEATAWLLRVAARLRDASARA